MNYIYTATNRLLEPHSYMYSKYGGERFLHSYLKDRVERLFFITASSPKLGNPLEVKAHAVLHTLLDGHDGLFPPSKIAILFNKPDLTFAYSAKKALLPKFPNNETLDTEALLDTLLNHFLDARIKSNSESDAILWVDRLSQRFEVRKKLFDYYLPGFRKCDGSDDNINLYTKFSLLLALAYAAKSKLNHLSTLLKVNDLMLSLPNHVHNENETECSLVLSVAVEIYAVLSCAQKQKIELHF